MKTRILNAAFITLALLWVPVFYASGQEKTPEAKEKELKLQQAIEEQKKAMTEQGRILKEQAGELPGRGTTGGERQSAGRDQDDPSRRGRGSAAIPREGTELFHFSPGANFPGYGYWGGNMDSERTSLDFSRSVRESDFSKQFSFDVEKNVKTVMMNISGDCRAGEIKVRILMPGGKTYSEIVIDESGNLNWRKSFAITESENNDKVGEWIFKINATKATGYFRISLQAF